MTVAIPEAASVAEGIVVPGSSTYETYGTRKIGSRASARRPRRTGATRRAAQQYGGQAAGAYAGTARGAARGAASASVPGDRSYQPVILAEFLIAVVIVAVIPIASGGSPNAKAKNSPSPYDTTDLRQLVAIGGVYFVLSLISSGNHGRISAWLGGLILIGLGLSKVSKGTLSSVFTAMSGIQPNTNTTSGGGGGHATAA